MKQGMVIEANKVFTQEEIDWLDDFGFSVEEEVTVLTSKLNTYYGSKYFMTKYTKIVEILSIENPQEIKKISITKFVLYNGQTNHQIIIETHLK